MKRTLVAIAFCFAVWTAFSTPADAQYPRYAPPAGSPFPEALNYFRRDVGVLDPYNTFVAPRRQLESDLARMQQQQQLNYSRNRAAIDQLRLSPAAPTGTGATYMNYMHYYPAGGAAAPRRR
jgi:hypothetical protein